MKRMICLLLSALLFVMPLASCGSGGKADDSSEVPSESGSAGDSTKEEPTNEEPTEVSPDTPLDMKAFLERFAEEHPDGSADKLCDRMLEDPYFRMFVKQDTQYYYPGMNYEFAPEGVKEASCIIDYITGSNSIVYAVIPAEGTDPEKLASAFTEAVDPYWTGDMKMELLSYVSEGRVFVALYKDGILPVFGEIAAKARDFTGMFHTYLKEHPETTLLSMVEYFASHQKLAEMMTNEVQEGQLRGFGDFEHEVEIKGFKEGAIMEPTMSPNTFICYVFRLPDGADVDAFTGMLKDNANLVWNVCVAADTVIVETEGDAVLFMMCSEGNAANE